MKAPVLSDVAADLAFVGSALSDVRDDETVPFRPPAHPDIQPGDERTALTQFLDQQRSIAAAALVDLRWEQASARLLPATDMTIGGIVKHLAWAEDRWFQVGGPRSAESQHVPLRVSAMEGPRWRGTPSDMGLPQRNHLDRGIHAFGTEPRRGREALIEQQPHG
jgi:hypothetical protein